MPTRKEAQVDNAVKSISDLVATLKKNGQLDKVVKKLAKEKGIRLNEVDTGATKKAGAPKKAGAKKKAAEKTTDAKERVKDINKTTIHQMKNYLDISGVKYTKCTLKKDWIDAIRVDGSRKYLEHINSL